MKVLLPEGFGNAHEPIVLDPGRLVELRRAKTGHA